MWTFLRKLNEQGTTIILTTHYLEEAEQMCRNIGIIDKGELIKNTSMRQLLNQVNTETLVLDIHSPLAEAPQLSIGATRLVDELTLEVDIAKGKMNETFVELHGLGIEVCSLRNKSNRLEELFVELVNHS
jgi:ABC-2 type transport system ATP-binding protein